MLRPIHFEIHADDVERASRFYAEVFGWEITPAMPEYHLAMTGDDEDPGIHGAIMQRRGDQSGDAVIAYVCTIDVPSLDEYLEKVKAAGGTQVVDKATIPGVGDNAYCKDTEGNIFGLLQPVG